MTPAAVRDTVATMLRGTKVGEVYDQQKVFDVVVWGTPARRRDLFALRRLPIELPGGGYAPLESVADVTVAPDAERDHARRRLAPDRRHQQRARAAISGRWRATSRPRSRQVPFDAGYHPEVLGEYTARAPSRRTGCWRSAPSSLLGILLVLHVDFGSARLVALVALTIPFALIGGVASVFLTGGVLSLGSLVGFVTVLGIAARNGIMLVSHYRHLEQRRRRAVRPRARDARRRGAAGADPDDRARHRPGARADHRRRRLARATRSSIRWRW